MKKALLILSLTSFMFASSPEAVTELEKPATIKVLIGKSMEGALIEVKGPCKVHNPHTGRLLKTHLLAKRYFLHGTPTGLKWGKPFKNIHQIHIVPSHAGATILVNGTEYRGCVTAFQFEDRVALVNEVTVEDFLKSTLTAEMRHSVDKEVMDSMTIAARTNAYFIAMKRKAEFWHVDADEVDYHGHGVTLLNTDVDSSVDATRHLIMVMNKRPFPASWTENSAGKTASYTAIFRRDTKSPSGVVAPVAERDRKNHAWCFTMKKDELARLMKTNRITEIDLFVDEASGKVYAMRIKDGKHHQDIDFTGLQELLGKNRLASNDFAVKLKEDQILFEGYGTGPGVGLCLYSADEMVEKGALATDLLKTFYPEALLTRVRSFDEFYRKPPPTKED